MTYCVKKSPINPQSAVIMAVAARLATGAVGGKKKLVALLSGHKIDINYMYRRIDKWRLSGIPSVWMLAIESATGLHRNQLRTAIYPPESSPRHNCLRNRPTDYFRLRLPGLGATFMHCRSARALDVNRSREQARRMRGRVWPYKASSVA
jgi:DNA-binding transcriptional regulator YdaS (Cro superfamily)